MIKEILIKASKGGYEPFVTRKISEVLEFSIIPPNNVLRCKYEGGYETRKPINDIILEFPFLKAFFGYGEVHVFRG
ncbi:unnamed protein product, partial [marine sediment metagenome]